MKRCAADPRGSLQTRICEDLGLAVQRVSAAPREATSPGFSSFCSPGTTTVQARSCFLREHDLFRKPVSTFQDHALKIRLAGQAAVPLAAASRCVRSRPRFAPHLVLILDRRQLSYELLATPA